MSIATKTGDDGTTALMFGRRVAKSDPRVDAYGTVDELNAALGLVRAACQDRFVVDDVHRIQKELVTLMGELAVAEVDRERYREKGFGFLTAAMTAELTEQIDALEKCHPLNLQEWAMPGGSPASAALDHARTVCRRAERRVVELGRADLYGEIIRYLNRLSDLCWLYSRFIEGKNSNDLAIQHAGNVQ